MERIVLKKLSTGVTVFLLALILGVSAVECFRMIRTTIFGPGIACTFGNPAEIAEPIDEIGHRKGEFCLLKERKAAERLETKPLQILFKKRPGYTEEARRANVTGSVRLRVTFKSDGTIGKISPISGLPHGLTERSILAVQQMRFRPAVRNGKAYTVRKTVVINFKIY